MKKKINYQELLLDFKDFYNSEQNTISCGMDANFKLFSFFIVEKELKLNKLIYININDIDEINDNSSLFIQNQITNRKILIKLSNLKTYKINKNNNKIYISYLNGKKNIF